MGLDSPASDPTALPNPGRADQLGDEVSAQGAPDRAVLCGVDGALADTEEEADGGVSGAACELGTSLDEAFVDEIGAGNDDESALPHLHAEDGTIFCT